MLLTWNPPAEDAESVTGYRILRRDPDRQRRLRVLVENTGNTDTIYFDSTAKSGRRYVYRIYALRGDEVSEVSDFNLTRYSRPHVPTYTPTATYTPSPTPTPTATPGKGTRSVQPPKNEKPGNKPPVSVRQPSVTGRILVGNTGATDTQHAHQVADISAQGFTTGPASYNLSGVEIEINWGNASQGLTFSIREATSAGEPGESIYDLSFQHPNADGRQTVFLPAPEGATLRPNTGYFLQIEGGLVSLHKTTSTDEDDTGLEGWTIDDNHWSYDGTDWTSSDSHVYEIIVRGSVIERAPTETNAARQLEYSRSEGQSPYLSATLDDSDDIDWYKTNLSFDAGARYRIDIDPVSLTDNDDIVVAAFHVDHPHYPSFDEYLALDKVADPPEGMISYHFRVRHNFGPYIKVWADNDTTGDYRIRVVYDPAKLWDGSEVLRGDLPHDDTTWATVTIGSTQIGVYHYYDDHDWFEVELVEGQLYAIVTVPYDSWLTTPDVGTVVRLYDSAGNQVAIEYSGSRLTEAVIDYTVPTGEGGTYYVDVSYSNFQDDPDTLANLGLTEGFETGASPFIGSRIHFIVSLQE